MNSQFETVVRTAIATGVAMGVTRASSALVARAGFATAEPVTITAGDSDEYDIQWMPPGSQEVSCFVNGKPTQLKFTCKSDHADLLNTQLQNLLAAANNGTGDKPMTDYNHEDGAASSRPTRIYWGGDDAKKGGIRLVGKWTPKAREGIRDGEWDRFSPEWQFHSVSQEPVGITANLGGLVNRAAFQGIQKVTAKLSETDEVADQSHAFIVQAKAVASQQKITSADAAIQVARANHSLYEDYRVSMRPTSPAKRATANSGRRAGEHPLTAIAREAYFNAEMNLVDESPFIVCAQELAVNERISFAEAAIYTAKAHYRLYQDYLACFRPGASRRANTATAGSKSPVHPFTARAKQAAANAAKHGNADHAFVARAKSVAAVSKIPLSEAAIQVARTEWGLYKSYLETLAV